MADQFSYTIESIQPFYKDGKTDYLFATVKLNVRRDGHHELGDNIHVFVQLPPESTRLPFEELENVATAEAFQLLKAAGALRVEDAV